MPQDKKEIISEIDYLQFQFTNIEGQLKGVEVPQKYAEKYLEEGLGVDGSSLGFLATQQSDLKIQPDLNTLHVLPWNERIARVICDVYKTDGTPFSSDPRGLLKKAINMAKLDFNCELKARPEIEFYVMDMNGEPIDIGGYMDTPPLDAEINLRRIMADFMMDFDIFPKIIHHEVGPAQMEIEFTMLDPLYAADMTQTVKQIIKLVSWNTGYIASFMPKPYTTEAGNGLHVHHMLYKNGENLFNASGGTPSDTLRYFVGGLLKHVQGLTAIFNPTVNSYKRLVPGHEAPVYGSWGIANRTALIRVPAYEESARIEYRGADTSANIYLLLALLLAAGLDGVKNKIEPIEGTTLNVDKLSDDERKEMGIIKTPNNLKDALQALQNDSYLCNFLGDEFIESFRTSKQKQWKEYVKNVKNPKTNEVTKWEFQTMFERV
ncbi:MAG: glutamine synthetase family protein [Asgard group archaeon]|nr:glutamine synthetase family protein [Asgard group archaeon]